MLPSALDVIDRLENSLVQNPDVPTAVMAGHEVVSSAAKYSDCFGEFPVETRAMGKELIRRTRDRMREIKLFALINDWYELRALPEGKPAAVRHAYWADPAMKFPEESDPEWMPYLLEGRGLKKSQRPLGRFSEYALQQSFASTYGARNVGILSTECNLCSSEIVMMAVKLYNRGIRRIVTFIPNVCTRAVDYGSGVLASGKLDTPVVRLGEPLVLTNVYMNAVDAWENQDVHKGTQIRTFRVQ